MLGRRRARVVMEEMREGSDLFSIHAYLPAQASFGFANDMRRQSSGGRLSCCCSALETLGLFLWFCTAMLSMLSDRQGGIMSLSCYTVKCHCATCHKLYAGLMHLAVVGRAGKLSLVISHFEQLGAADVDLQVLLQLP